VTVEAPTPNAIRASPSPISVRVEQLVQLIQIKARAQADLFGSSPIDQDQMR